MPRKKSSNPKVTKTLPPLEQANFQNPYIAPSRGPSNILVILLIVVSFFAGYLFFKLKSVEKAQTANTQPAVQQAPTRPTSLTIVKPSSTTDHWRGNANNRYVWVEYADYECPYCKQIHPSLLSIMNTYGNQMSWVFRHFPLPFHPKAQKSAEAAECAADLGGNEAYWKMTDLIYEKMPAMELTDLPDLATQIGLNQAAFKDCLDSGRTAQKVKDQLAEGTKAGIQATPTGVIYDMKTGKNLMIEGALPEANLKQQLDTFIAANK